MTPSESDTIEREIHIDARPETVFPFFTDVDKMMRWTGGIITLDPRPGGLYRVAATDGWIQRGEFIEVIPPERVIFTFGLEGEGGPIPPGASRVEVNLIPDGDGTLVRLRHTGLPAGQGDSFGGGWQRYLDRLVIAATGGDPGPDDWCESDPLQQTILVDASPATVFAYLVDPTRMIKWMGVEARAEARPGGEYFVNITGKSKVQGEYLEVSPFTRVVHTWGWTGAGGAAPTRWSTVVWTLTQNDNGTRVHLLHHGLSESERPSHAEGWRHYLPRLQVVAVGGQPGPDPWATPTAETSASM